MLDIKFIRENADLITEAVRKKRINFKVADLIELDIKRLALQTEVESLRAEQNKASDEIASAGGDQSKRNAVIGSMKSVKDSMQAKEEELKKILEKWRTLMLSVPNVPDITVPEGEDDSHNVEIKSWGEQTRFNFAPKDHIEIMKNLDMLDLDRGVKIAGFRGYVLKNDGVLLSFAIWQLALKFFTEKGFSPMIMPSLVKRDALLGTGFLPQGEEDLYKTQDGDYLAGTAEVGTMGYFMNEVIDLKVPIKTLSFSPCFRREAGSHSKDVKGLIRVHEFYKLEQVILCVADHSESVKNHEILNRNTEEFIELLGIPYHTVVNCGGDLGLGQVKKYDVELWVPMEQKYREISSASYFHDFQTRRLNIRYRDSEGKLKYAHSLNCTAIPTPRILVSLVENYQQADGTIKVPSALIPYIGKEKIG
ncbi:MAG: serine--tRNA ligase [Candidatus Vogelbacteria bacterium]|nr:serine--tRNA ligase [Candidatus Vogelbacteria bacterium]